MKSVSLRSAVALGVGCLASAAIAGTITLTTPAGTLGVTTVTSTSANCLAVGPNGSTNPSFNVDCSTASAATGVNVKAAAAAGGVALTAISSGTNEALFVAAKGTGQVNIGGTTATLAGLQVAQTASAVNDVIVTNAATGSVPTIATGGASVDANVGIALAGNGTGAVLIGGTTTTLAGLQVAQTASRVNDILVTPTATTVVPQIAVGGAGADANVALAVLGNGTGSVLFGGTTAANAAASVAHGTANVNQLILTGTNTGGTSTLTIGGSGADANAPFAVAANGTGALLLGGTTTTLAGLQVAQTASRVNDILVTPGATGALPQVASGGAGADANLGIAVLGTGTGSVFLGGTTAANAAASVAHGTANVNQVILTGTNTGTAPSITVGGSGADANRNLSVAGIGTGLVVLGQAICTSSGATPQTCNGQRGIATTASMTTAASTSAAVYVINNSSVSTSSLVECTIVAYSGTRITNGTPVIDSCISGATTITVGISNIHTANALSGTVGIGFVVLN